MARADVLVDADWAEAHLNDPKIVFVEGHHPVSINHKSAALPQHFDYGAFPTGDIAGQTDQVNLPALF